MTKIRIYRVLGLILIAYGIVGFLCYFVKQVSEAGMNALSYGFFLGKLSMYAINPFFWAGWILLKKAMKNDPTIKRPTWLSWLLTIYIICGFILATLSAIVVIGTFIVG